MNKYRKILIIVFALLVFIAIAIIIMKNGNRIRIKNIESDVNIQGQIEQKIIESPTTDDVPNQSIKLDDTGIVYGTKVLE